MRYRRRNCEEQEYFGMMTFLVPSCDGKTKGRKQINHPNLQMEKAVFSTEVGFRQVL